MTNRELMEKAFEAQTKAYAPYSHYEVGAALLTKGGKVYLGANVECASFQAGVCAERNALFHAAVCGERDFEAIAIVGKRVEDPQFSFCSPCGICRQALRGFCDPKTFRILLGESPESIKSYTLEELLPESFGPGSLKIRR